MYQAGWNVVGTARTNNNAEKLNALAPFKIVVIDTSDETSILEAARQLEGQPIDLFINNAVNTAGPFLVTRTLLPNLQLAAKPNGGASVVQLSSYLGSIGSYTTETTGFFKQVGYGYSSSKAVLNMITRSLAFDLKPSGVVVVSVRPGYVDRNMTQDKTRGLRDGHGQSHRQAKP
ncbi:hypothetical protein F442_23028 [Phytophthora nicotianae P10297]|uniref:Uncharacterized protein n=1 Tax=Phytophthora nicotianae P10297 TaxID=1317064 RepID=W2XYY6_PHYNI|nr:hypothetical protein F442_23028 [Phytophthora nicotianae P10297]